VARWGPDGDGWSGGEAEHDGGSDTGTGMIARDDFFAAAFGLLAAEGPEGLNVLAVCRPLGVTRGSFYHHFDSMPAFVDELMAHWERTQSSELIARSERTTDAKDRNRLLTELGVGLPHAGEAALRAWSRSNPVVARAQARVDKARWDHLVAANRDRGIPLARARTLAWLDLATLAGLQQLHHPPTPRLLRQVYGELEHLADLAAEESRP
jgi:AcrR family transcriptional regulator